MTDWDADIQDLKEAEALALTNLNRVQGALFWIQAKKEKQDAAREGEEPQGGEQAVEGGQGPQETE